MTDPAAFSGFTRETVRFFAALRKNNNRDWFLLNKETYDRHVLEPAKLFVTAMGERLKTIAPGIVAVPAVNKSIFRIYRDTRFSKNKLPYKTHVAAVFHHRGNWQGSAGYYFHIEPGEVFLGGGIYMPDSGQLKKIRAAIANRSEEFSSIVDNKSFKRKFGGLEGDISFHAYCAVSPGSLKAGVNFAAADGSGPGVRRREPRAPRSARRARRPDEAARRSATALPSRCASDPWPACS